MPYIFREIHTRLRCCTVCTNSRTISGCHSHTAHGIALYKWPFTYLLTYVYMQIDDDRSGYIDLQELNKALQMVGIRIPGYELRDLVEAADRENDDRIDLEEFKDVRSPFASVPAL